MRFGGDQPYEVDPGAVDAPAGRDLPRIPPWVTDTAKWLTLSRTERRKLERHHRKLSGE
jgi:hypothetical protein